MTAHRGASVQRAREPTKALTGLILLLGKQRHSIAVLAALQPAERTLGLVQQNRATRAVDLALAIPSKLMLHAERIAFSSASAKPSLSGVREQKHVAVSLEPILREAGFDQLRRHEVSRRGGRMSRASGETEAALAVTGQPVSGCELREQ